MPDPQQRPNAEILEANRLQLILHRLGHDFYDFPPASDRIALSIWDELNHSEEYPPVIPS